MKYAVILTAALLSVATMSRAQESATVPATAPAEPAATLPTTASTDPSTTAPATAPTVEATTVPSTAPASQPSVRIAPSDRSKLLPGGYAILNTRSIFMKGRVPTPPSTGTGVGATSLPPTTMPAARAEHKIVFVGVTETDGTASAMFEDTGAGKILSTKLNESIASGKVTSISLDEITYTADGKSTKVLVGQALDGTDGPSVSARVTITDNGNGPPTSGPVVAPAGGDASIDAAANDVLERMRARRRAGQ